MLCPYDSNSHADRLKAKTGRARMVDGLEAPKLWRESPDSPIAGARSVLPFGKSESENLSEHPEQTKSA